MRVDKELKMYSYLRDISSHLINTYDLESYTISIDWNQIHSYSSLMNPTMVLHTLDYGSFMKLLIALKTSMFKKIFGIVTDKILYHVPTKNRNTILDRAETTLDEVKCVKDMWNLISKYIHNRSTKTGINEEFISLIDNIIEDQ
jgi:hypothetical protein